MDELLDIHKIQIEKQLYKEVMLSIESEYNTEGVIDINKKNSNQIVYKDKKAAIKKVAEAIKIFSEKNGLSENVVKDYLLKIIESERKSKNMLKEEYNIAEEIVLTNNEEER